MISVFKKGAVDLNTINNDKTITLHLFKKIYDQYYSSLCSFLLFYTQESSVIEDIVQEVFLQLWENRDKEITFVKTYIFQCARNKILNHLRNENTRKQLLTQWFIEQEESDILDDEKFNTEALISKVEDALNTLPQQCKETFILCKIEKMSYRDVAQLKQVSIKTVENQMVIAFKKLRKQLLFNKISLTTISILYNLYYFYK